MTTRSPSKDVSIRAAVILTFPSVLGTSKDVPSIVTDTESSFARSATSFHLSGRNRRGVSCVFPKTRTRTRAPIHSMRKSPVSQVKPGSSPSTGLKKEGKNTEYASVTSSAGNTHAGAASKLIPPNTAIVFPSTRWCLLSQPNPILTTFHAEVVRVRSSMSRVNRAAMAYKRIVSFVSGKNARIV